MRYARMPIEVESPEEYGYGKIRFNLSESSIADQSLRSLDLTIPDLTLLYGEHRGSEKLRALIIEDSPRLAIDDVLITGGAAGALFIIATALLSSDDHLVVVRPNYATNIETPRAIGCAISFVDLTFENGFSLDFDQLIAAITPKTKLISVTCPHNPTGTMMTHADLLRLAEIAESRNVLLLVDETYRDLALTTTLPLAASLGRHVVSVSSLSKAYGVPGIRVGWIITTDPTLQTLFLAAKEQISICGSVINEWVAEAILERRVAFLNSTLPQWRRRLDRIASWISQDDRLEWVRPSGGVVCFPRMKSDPPGGTDAFYRRLLENHGTYVGPGHWFEMSDRHFRLGFAWPTAEELEGGLAGISAALDG
jgi:aspartate/methionine/tyrosine aminotransferase